MSVQVARCRDGAELAYVVFPFKGNVHQEKTPLVMVTGFTGVKEDWLHLPQLFSHERSVMIFDNRFMGDSYLTSRDKQPLFKDFATDVIDLMDCVSWKKAILMGWSMGGVISQIVALEFPERIERLILYCTTMSFTKSTFKPKVNLFDIFSDASKSKDERRIAGNLLLFPNEFLENKANKKRVLETIEKMAPFRRPAKGIALQGMAITDYDNTSNYKIENISCPTLVLAGEEDYILHVGNARELAKRIPGSIYVEWKGVGHAPHLQDMGLVYRVVNDFCKGKINSKL